MFEHDCLDTCCFVCFICTCFVFLHLHLFSAIEHVSHGKARLDIRSLLLVSFEVSLRDFFFKTVATANTDVILPLNVITTMF